jgi:hypothetical protein
LVGAARKHLELNEIVVARLELVVVVAFEHLQADGRLLVDFVELEDEVLVGAGQVNVAAGALVAVLDVDGLDELNDAFDDVKVVDGLVEFGRALVRFGLLVQVELEVDFELEFVFVRAAAFVSLLEQRAI